MAGLRAIHYHSDIAWNEKVCRFYDGRPEKCRRSRLFPKRLPLTLTGL